MGAERVMLFLAKITIEDVLLSCMDLSPLSYKISYKPCTLRPCLVRRFEAFPCLLSKFVNMLQCKMTFKNDETKSFMLLDFL